MPVVSVGDNVVDRYPHLGRLYPGGNCVNVAVHVARSGVRAGYAGAVGADESGRGIRAARQREGVEVPRLRVEDGPTATADIELVDGDRVFVGSDKGVSVFEPDAGDLDYLEDFAVVHSSYCSGLEAHIPAFAARAPVSYDFADLRGADYAAPLLAYTTFASFSATDLSEAETERLVRWAHQQGARTVLATRGAGGAVLFDGGRVYHQQAVETTVVDTLGAGDAFIARALIGRLDGESPEQFIS
jgi:fructoselysine 6-kinase